MSRTVRGEQPGSRPIPPVDRLVVKVGTSSLVGPDGTISRARLAKVVREVAEAVRGTPGRSCVLVSSGAIATGLSPLGLTSRPKRLPALQAAAAVGQGRLMAEYGRLFARRGLVAAQVLLTQDDFVRRRRFVNAQRTFEHLLASGVVPVVNENDTVATEEITFGDNDRLAALVAIMVKADLLILLSDVEGVFTARPGLRGARLVEELVEPLEVQTAGPGALGSGGMASKLEAASLASSAGVPTVVANAARRTILQRVLNGDPVGTWIPARAGRTRARKAWMAFAATPRGRILVDEGAERALRTAGRSLLAAGVTGVEGSFQAGDTVEVAGPGGRAFARGVCSYSAEQLPPVAGRSSLGLQALPGVPDREVIHRDELVLMPSEEWEAGR